MVGSFRGGVMVYEEYALQSLVVSLKVNAWMK